jgi:hypothetical protein
MPGYREHGFDPSAGGDYGRPQRPFNWVQWLGVACLFVGAAIMLAYVGGGLGLLPKLLDSPTPGTAFVMIAIPLIASRREAGTLSVESKRRRTVIIAVALAVCALTAALVFYFKGA